MLDHCTTPEESKEKIQVGKMWLPSLFPSLKNWNEMMPMEAFSNPLTVKTCAFLALPETTKKKFSPVLVNIL